MTDKIIKLGAKRPAVESRFKCGDVVALRSGGSFMTVRSVDSDGVVMADWMVDDGTPAYGDYLPEMLMFAHEAETEKVDA